MQGFIWPTISQLIRFLALDVLLVGESTQHLDMFQHSTCSTLSDVNLEDLQLITFILIRINILMLLNSINFRVCLLKTMKSKTHNTEARACK